MKDTGHDAPRSDIGLHGQPPALQVICLGSGGGPSEDNVTGFLVRSVGSDWAKGSLLAVDAGSHLAPITRILERSFPVVSRPNTRADSNGSRPTSSRRRISPSPSPSSPAYHPPPKPEPTILSSGPFAGLKFPNESARANALHVLRTYVSTYLITHPHLDHLSGFAINTAAFHATSRPKTLAALPSTVNAIKDHIFNDVIWPNLSDEDGGVGFVTFQRLKEGGDLMVGEGEGRGYIDVCDGLAAKAFKVSHGTCTKSPPSHRHRGSIAGMSDSQSMFNGSMQAAAQDHVSTSMTRSLSISHYQSTPGTPGLVPRSSFHAQNNPTSQMAVHAEGTCVVDSTAFFLRDEHTQREVLVFGDVEPDSISLTPRNHAVWQEAARKIAYSVLGGIFIECSYDDSQPDALLFGHLCPRHLITELQQLSHLATEAKAALQLEKANRKRKRSGPNGLENFARSVRTEHDRKRSRSLVKGTVAGDERRRSSAPDHSPVHPAARAITLPLGEAMNQYNFCPDGITHRIDGATSPKSVVAAGQSTTTAAATATVGMPLSGLKVVIIHIKDTLKDGPHVSESILAELEEYEARLSEDGQGLGCEFVISHSGESYWF